jgi:imidazolonepropionase-like amidohydrolase
MAQQSLVVGWLLLQASCLSAQSTGPNTIILQHANVVDGISDEPVRDATVLIENGRIVSIGHTAEKASANSAVIDLSGRWLLPGYIDAHVHFKDLKAARSALASGVTTARTMQVDHYIDIGMRELHRQGEKDLPDIVAAGYQLRPDMIAFEAFLLDFPKFAGMIRPKVAGEENVRRLVQANVQHHVDLIKILATERGGTPDTDPRKRTFTDEEIVAIVDEARKAGLPVAAHAHGDEGAAAAVRAGVRSIEHGSFMSDETLALMKVRGTYLVPTIGIESAVSSTSTYKNSPPVRRERLHTMSQSAHGVAQRAWKLGIPLVAGSDGAYDLDLAPDFTVANEVVELVKAGIPPMEAIKAATFRAAECLGISARTGSIRPGGEADLVVVEGDPLANITAVKKIVMVINDGQIAINRLSR